jgi:hypothetical protein
LTRAVVPVFSCAIRAWRTAAALIWACPAITATVAPPGLADSAARTAAAGLSPAGAVTGARGRVTGMYGLIAKVVASFGGQPGSEAWHQAAAEVRRRLPPEPSPDR